MTRISELLAKGPTWSFEFFPPKSPAGLVTLEAAVDELSALEPSYVSVTYGALGTTRDTTRDLVIRLTDEQAYPAMPHLTCVGHTRAELVDLLESYRAAGVDNILALAGDPPADGSDPGGDFTYATELVELIGEIGDFSVGVAAFPEVHPRSTDRDSDRRRLADKLRQADFAMTTFFFEAEHYRRLIDELGELDCATPIIPGVMPFTSVAGVRRMSAMNGTAIPAWLEERLDAVDGDAEATRQLGVTVAADLSAELVELGAPGIHLYALNRATSVQEIYDRLGLRT